MLKSYTLKLPEGLDKAIAWIFTVVALFPYLFGTYTFLAGAETFCWVGYFNWEGSCSDPLPMLFGGFFVTISFLVLSLCGAILKSKVYIIILRTMTVAIFIAGVLWFIKII